MLPKNIDISINLISNPVFTQKSFISIHQFRYNKYLHCLTLPVTEEIFGNGLTNLCIAFSVLHYLICISNGVVRCDGYEGRELLLKSYIDDIFASGQFWYNNVCYHVIKTFPSSELVVWNNFQYKIIP